MTQFKLNGNNYMPYYSSTFQTVGDLHYQLQLSNIFKNHMQYVQAFCVANIDFASFWKIHVERLISKSPTGTWTWVTESRPLLSQANASHNSSINLLNIILKQIRGGLPPLFYCRSSLFRYLCTLWYFQWKFIHGQLKPLCFCGSIVF